MVFLYILWFIGGAFLDLPLMKVYSMIFLFSDINSMVFLLEVHSMVFSLAALFSAVLSSLT